MSKKIGVLIGSLRKGSFNRKIAEKMLNLAPPSLQLNIIEIGDLPLYNQDGDDEGKPATAWLDFRKQVNSCAGVIFCTPEYNRSVPAVLKNAIDVGSRPYGQSVWSKKPAAIISVSIGAIGGFGANHHLRQSFVFLDMPCMQQPEAYIGQAANLFDTTGKMINEASISFLQKFVDAYAAWVEKQA